MRTFARRVHIDAARRLRLVPDGGDSVVSQRRSPSMPLTRDAVTERRKDYERRAMVDVALALAELDANWGDYEYALEYLDAANELTSGSLASRWAVRRRRWLYAARGYTAS
jgi:hypothetical protein